MLINSFIHNDDVKAAIQASLILMGEIQAAKDGIKDYANDLKEKYEIKPAEFTAIVTTIFKQNIEEQKERVESLEQAVIAIEGE